jgi:hypothetical protein
MPKFSDITFTTTDIIKGVTFFCIVGAMWADLKADKVKTKADISFLQYQVNELKQICGILPKPINLEDEQTNRRSN